MRFMFQAKNVVDSPLFAGDKLKNITTNSKQRSIELIHNNDTNFSPIIRYFDEFMAPFRVVCMTAGLTASFHLVFTSSKVNLSLFDFIGWQWNEMNMHLATNGMGIFIFILEAEKKKRKEKRKSAIGCHQIIFANTGTLMLLLFSIHGGKSSIS